MLQVIFVITYVALWALALIEAFLMVGLLRQMALLHWRLDQLAATTPSRANRNRLATGAQAPDFTLPSLDGREVALSDFRGRDVLLVFTQPGCGPCHSVTPALERVRQEERLQVLAVSNGNDTEFESDPPHFPVLIQEKWAVSRKYEVYVTPFAFLIGPGGQILAKGLINNDRHIRFLLSGVKEQPEAAPVA